jgi:hypothetical protein
MIKYSFNTVVYYMHTKFAANTAEGGPYSLMAKLGTTSVTMAKWLLSISPDGSFLMIWCSVVSTITIFPSVLHLVGTRWVLGVLASGVWAAAAATVTPSFQGTVNLNAVQQPGATCGLVSCVLHRSSFLAPLSSGTPGGCDHPWPSIPETTYSGPRCG